MTDAKKTLPSSVDVGIITAISTEIAALLRVLEIDSDYSQQVNSPLVYWTHEYWSQRSNRNIRIAVSVLNGEAGNTEAALTTAHFLRDMAPRLMCFVGTSAGIEGKVRIGDVVLPHRIHDRTMKVFKDNEFHNRSQSYHLIDVLERMLKIYPISERNLHRRIREEIPDAIERAKLVAQTKGLDQTHFTVDASIHDGSMLSDNTLIRDPRFFQAVMDSVDEKCRGGEMEGAGFVRACQLERADFPWIVFRGISDFGDSRKDDSFQLLAASNACVALRLFLEQSLSLDLLPENPRARSSPTSFEFNLMSHIRNAFRAERWQEVCRIGAVISRPLWLAGHNALRLEVGHLVESAAAYVGDTELRARALIDDLGWTSVKTGSLDEGKKYIRDGMRLAQDSGDFYILSKGFRHLASVARQHGDFDGADDLLGQAREITESIQDTRDRDEIVASLAASQGKILFERMKYAEALEAFQKARDVFYQQGDSERAIKLYSWMGKCYERQGQTPQAMAHYSEGREKALETGRYDEFAENTHCLLPLVISEKGSEAGRELAKQARDFATANGLWNEARQWERDT